MNTHHFLGLFATRYRMDVTGFDGAASRALEQHSWPGNVRELAHTVERAVLMASDNEVRPVHLGLVEPHDQPNSIDDMTFEEVERLLVTKVLKRHKGNVSRAAEALGISRSAFYRRLQKYGL